MKLLFGILISFLSVGALAFAHHGTPASYFMEKSVTVTGLVTEFAFSYPHPQIYFDVKDESGKVVHSATEIAPTPAMLKKSGWAKDSIKPGDEIKITMHPSKASGSQVGLATDISINGKKLELGPQPPPSPQAKE